MEFKMLKQVAKELNEKLGAKISTVAVTQEKLAAAVAAFEPTYKKANNATLLSPEVQAVLGITIAAAKKGTAKKTETAEPAAETTEETTAIEFPVEYPEPAEMTKEVAALLKAEYEALKALKAPSAEEKARKAYLVTVGKALDAHIKQLKANAAAAAKTPTDEPLTLDELKQVAGDMNTVLKFGDPIDLELDADGLLSEIKDNLGEIKTAADENDFLPVKGKVTFSASTAALLKRLGVPVPEPKKAAAKPADKLRTAKPRSGEKAARMARFEEMVKKGTTAAEAKEALVKEFPSVNPATIGTEISDARNPKYTYFKTRVIVVNAKTGKLEFADAPKA